MTSTTRLVRGIVLTTVLCCQACNARNEDEVATSADRHDSADGKPKNQTGKKPKQPSGPDAGKRGSLSSENDDPPLQGKDSTDDTAVGDDTAVEDDTALGDDEADDAADEMPLPDADNKTLNTDFTPSDCPELSLTIDFDATERYETDRGVLVEVAQRPVFDESNRVEEPVPEIIPPETWDRAEFPEGACVMRIRGIDASCYSNEHSNAVYYPKDEDAGSPIGQASYFARRWSGDIDLCDWPVPGCPLPSWGSFNGYWWYLTQRKQDVLLVACASSCEGFFRATAQLELRPESGASLCEQ